MDQCFLLGHSLMLRGQSACSTHIQGTQACDPGNTWATYECLLRYVQCVSLQFACLVTFSWMRSQRAIESLWSEFHEPEPSHAHAEILWHGYFHASTVDSAVWLAFKLVTVIVLAMQHSMGGAHVPEKSYTCHPRFPTHFACHNVLISPGWRIPMH